MTMKPKLALLGLVVSAVALLPSSLAAQQQDSVAEAARTAQAAKKEPTKPVRVLTNDDLDAVKGTINVVGEQPAAPADQAASDKTKAAADQKGQPAASADQKGKAEPAAKDEAYWRKAFADARKKLADDMHELDVDQRDYNLKQQQYYSDPNTAMKEQYNRSDLNDMKKQIDDMTAAVAKDKQAISDLEDQLRQAGGDPGWAAEQK